MAQVEFTLEELLKAMKQQTEEIVDRAVDRFDKRIDRMESKMDRRFDIVDFRLDRLEGQYDELGNRLDSFARTTTQEYEKLDLRISKIKIA